MIPFIIFITWLTLCFGFLLLSVAVVAWVSWKFYTVAIGCDLAVFKESQRAMDIYTKTIASIPKPDIHSPSNVTLPMTQEATEGTFEPYNEEVALLNEQVAHLRRSGLNDEELDQFIKQAATEQGEN
jgi:hypothetical protein